MSGTFSSDRQESKFPVQTSMPSGSSVTGFSSGVNFSITFANFVAGLGVTGSIVQSGDPLGTPVLNTQGTVNNIRNMEDGPGVKFSVSPQNGVIGAHNFVSGSGGVDILTDETALIPIIRSIAPGPGIAVAATNGAVRISSSAVPGNNIVIVNSAADFPAAVGGVRTLGPELIYLISGEVDMGSDRFMVLSNTTVKGNSAFIDKLTSATTGELFSSTEGATIAVNNLKINCPNAGIINHTSITPKTGVVSFDRVIVEECDHIGEFTNTGVVTYTTLIIEKINTTGATFAGSLIAFNLDTILVQEFVGTLIDFGTSTLDVVDVENATIFSDNGANVIVDGLANSGNINLGGNGALRVINIIGDFTSTGNILPSDLRWNFSQNNKFPDSVNRAYLSMPSNAVVTAIAVIDTPVLVSGVWTDVADSRFVNTTGGRTTYLGTRGIAATVDLTFTATKQGGGTDSYRIHIAKNGVPDVNAIAEFSSDTTRSPNLAIVSLITLVENDFLEVFVECTTSTSDILITAANFVVSE